MGFPALLSLIAVVSCVWLLSVVPPVTADEPHALQAALISAMQGALCRIDASEADSAFLPATRDDALPDGYEPPDLISLASLGLPQRGSWQLRSTVVPDMAAMIEAAGSDGVALWVASGYRSYGVQAVTYRYWVGLRGVDGADRVSARPGHSQHQLGTAADMNLSGGLGSSQAGTWLWDHAQEYGFVFPYTAASTARSGYIFEPWHVRWVGKDLAQVMWEDGYEYSSDLIADDYVKAAREVLTNRSDGQCGV